MPDRATPNLPSRDFDATERFYGAIGFDLVFRDRGWMIMARGALQLEFFSYPDLDPLASSFGACLRVDDLDALYDACVSAGVPQHERGQPRLAAPKMERSGLRIGYLIDPDGSLLRLIQNP